MIPQNDREAVTLILEGIVRRGCTLVEVMDDTWNPDDRVPVETVEQAVNAVMAVDEAYVFVNLPDGRSGHIWFVLGNEPIEVACDYTVNLSVYIDPITDPWWN